MRRARCCADTRLPDNAVLWRWQAGPHDAEAGVVEARVEHLQACGVEALLLDASALDGLALGRIKAEATLRRLPIVWDAPAEACWVRTLWPTDTFYRLAEQLVAGSGKHEFVCTAPDAQAASLVSEVRRLRRRVERLAWERFQ